MRPQREFEERVLIYLMRHGIAGDSDPDRFPDDDLRPLTKKGKRRTLAVARGMAVLRLDIERIVTSPLVRARQTAIIAAEAMRIAARKIVESTTLSPAAPPGDILLEMRNISAGKANLLVGHEPHLSRLLSLLITGRVDLSQIELKKAGLVCIECPEVPVAGSGVLLFHLKPRHLVALGEARVRSS